MKYFIYCRKSQEAEDRQVMSLQSQQDEIDRLINANPDIQIVGIYTEAFSAKQPGRPQFNEMMNRIDKGEAEGVIAWHPDRLARNSIDGGRIIYALDQGNLKTMKFCSYSFTNDPQGKFMLTIIFGYSKYQVDALSVVVKRGMNAKLKMGWKPNLAPLGYRNCKETKTIMPDKGHFEMVKGVFELMLTGNHTPASIHRIVCNEWQYTTPKRKKSGGKKPALSTIYKILNNPFHAGYIRWNGKLYSGSHKTVVTKSQFDKVQKLLGHAVPVKTHKRSFPFTGLFTCGACGLSITAETKTKPSGKQYTYYHCTRRHRNPVCTQPAINSKYLEKQVGLFLDQICLPDAFIDWLSNVIKGSTADMSCVQEKLKTQAQKQVRDISNQLSNLTDLRTRDLLPDEEFLAKREKLIIEQEAAQENAREAECMSIGLEPVHILSLFSNRAKKWYFDLDDDGKRKLLKIVSYNPRVQNKKAILVAKKPLLELSEIAKFPRLCRSVEKVRTPNQAGIKRKLDMLAGNTEVIELAETAKAFIRDHEPELLGFLQPPSDNHTAPTA